MPRTDLLSQTHPEKLGLVSQGQRRKGVLSLLLQYVCSLNCALPSASRLCTEKRSNLCNFGALT